MAAVAAIGANDCILAQLFSGGPHRTCAIVQVNAIKPKTLHQLNMGVDHHWNIAGMCDRAKLV